MKEMGPSVPDEIRTKLRNLLEKYDPVFSKGPLDLGRTDLVLHGIDTQDNKPVRQALRHQPLAMLGEIYEMLEQQSRKCWNSKS
jgi:hypothetical protein